MASPAPTVPAEAHGSAASKPAAGSAPSAPAAQANRAVLQEIAVAEKEEEVNREDEYQIEDRYVGLHRGVHLCIIENDFCVIDPPVHKCIHKISFIYLCVLICTYM
jgi:hypothetical protein